MLDRILDLYTLLFKYAKRKLPLSNELFEELESGWDSYPTGLKKNFTDFSKLVNTLDIDIENIKSDAQIRNTLVTLKYSLAEISSIASMMECDIEEVLSQTLDIGDIDSSEILSLTTYDYQKEILRNDSNAANNYSENSFVSIFHENQIWDFREYWKFELAIYCLAEQEKSNVTSKLYVSVFSTYSYLLMSIGCCLDSNDGFSISNLDYDSLYSMRERIQLVVEGLFQNKMPANDIFEFKNPYL